MRYINDSTFFSVLLLLSTFVCNSSFYRVITCEIKQEAISCNTLFKDWWKRVTEIQSWWGPRNCVTILFRSDTTILYIYRNTRKTQNLKKYYFDSVPFKNENWLHWLIVFIVQWLSLLKLTHWSFEHLLVGEPTEWHIPSTFSSLERK